jgi:hypothetical protein
MPNTDPYNGSFTIPDRLHVDALSFDGDLLTISGGVRGSLSGVRRNLAPGPWPLHPYASCTQPTG